MTPADGVDLGVCHGTPSAGVLRGKRQISTLEQQIVTLKEALEGRDQELDAARAANRELFTNVNKRH